MGPPSNEEIKAAVDLAKWQGQVEGRLEEGGRRIDDVAKSVGRIEEKVGEIGNEQALQKGKVAVYATIGSLIGTGAIALIVAFASKGLG